jgi:Holliday junction resolvase RusA-like endonuclease
VQRQVLNALGGKPEIHFGPIKMIVKFYLRRPLSLPKKITHHIKKPDIDNLVKAIKDANKGILFRDDSQIVELTVTKDYNAIPRVVIALEVLA